jgi:GNAT superfamily N-acetyltransferase
MINDIVTEAVTKALGPDWDAMTFPSFRHALSCLGDTEGDTRFVARRAHCDEQPAGLALAQVLANDRTAAELMSLYVVSDFRDRGLATELLTGLEQDLVSQGISRLSGTYMTGRPSLPALERVLSKCGFSSPVARKVAVRFTPEEPSRAPWYQKAQLPPNSEIFPWAELPAEEGEALRRSQAERGWIPTDLEPWRCDQNFDRVSSVGLRKSGEIVGWVINHRMTPDLVSFTISFMRPDLARRGAIFGLYVASLKRLQGTGVTCTYVTDATFESMVRFTLRRVAPFVSFCGETRGVTKELRRVDGAGAHP